MDDPGQRAYAFEGYRLDAVARILSGPDGAAIPLTAKALDVLLHLIGNRERVVGKDELLAAVWPGRVVEENNLTQAISALRRALGTGAGDHRFIVTVPGRGYRFVAAVDAPGPASGDAVVPDASMRDAASGPPRRGTRAATAVAAAAVIAAIVLVAAVWKDRAVERPGAAAKAPVTLAVLPFRSVDGARDPLLELGMAETLIARLSRSTSLRVLSLGSMQAFVGHGGDPLRTGMSVGADYVIDGSTQRRGGAIRVNARLLSLPDGHAVWAGTFDQSPDQVFTLQDALAAGVSTALSSRYAAPPRSAPCDGADADAYRAYLRGRYLINRPAPRTLPRAIAAFEEAIARDATCARAWAGIAFAQRALAITGDRDPRVQFPLSNAAVARALAIDPQSAEALAARGFNQFWNGWDWPAAEASLRAAIALNPNLVDPHFALAHLLNNIGRHREAAEEARIAAQLDPLSPLVNALAAGFVGNAGQAQDMRARLDQVLELEPGFWIARLMRAQMAATAGDHDAALMHARRAVAETGGNNQSLSNLGVVYARIGRRDDAARVLQRLEARDRTAYVSPSLLARSHLIRGDRQRALALYERGYRERDIGLVFLREVRSDLRDEPGYRALMARMRLPIDAPPAPATATARGEQARSD